MAVMTKNSLQRACARPAQTPPDWSHAPAFATHAGEAMSEED